MKISTAALAVLLSPLAVLAGNAANPDAIELAPLPMPVEFKSDMDSPVAFDASTTVVVDCPDAAAVGWLADHFPHYQQSVLLTSQHRSSYPVSYSTDDDIYQKKVGSHLYIWIVP